MECISRLPDVPFKRCNPSKRHNASKPSEGGYNREEHAVMEEIKSGATAQQSAPTQEADNQPKKFCKHCGERIDVECIICPKCGKQVEQLKQETAQPSVVINNTNTNANVNQNTNNVGNGNYPYKSKIVTLLLCLFLGGLGVHRFYVGKMGTGLIWLFTGGFFFIGWIVDFIVILIGGFRDKAGMPLK